MPAGNRLAHQAKDSRAVSPALALAAILLVSLTMRAPIAALPPLISFVSHTLDLTPGQAGLLTSIPVLAMALLTFSASGLIKRVGITNAMTVSLLCLIVGQLIRSAPLFVFAIIGTALIGAGIAIGNVAIPMLIARDYQDRSAGMSGLHSAMMNVGSALATILVVPLAFRLGWQLAAALWALVGVGALALWRWRWRLRSDNTKVARGGALVLLGDSNVAPDFPEVLSGNSKALSRDSEVLSGNSKVLSANTEALSEDVRSVSGGLNFPPSDTKAVPLGATFALLTALLCVVYIGQSSSFYAVTAWLPEMLTARLGIDRAAAAGMAMPFQLLASVGALGVPILLSRGLPMRVIAMVFVLFWLTLPIGLLVLPDLALGWIFLSGMAHGGCFTIMLTLLTQRAPSADAARRASTIVLTVGYAAAAVAPTLYGAIFHQTGSWTVPLSLILVVLGVMGTAMWFACQQGSMEVTRRVS